MNKKVLNTLIVLVVAAAIVLPFWVSAQTDASVSDQIESVSAVSDAVSNISAETTVNPGSGHVVRI